MFYLNTILIPSYLARYFAREFYITDSKGTILNAQYSKPFEKLISNGRKHQALKESRNIKEIVEAYYQCYEPLTFTEFCSYFPDQDKSVLDLKYHNTNTLFCLDFVSKEVYLSRSMFLRFLSSELKRPNDDENISYIRKRLKGHAGDIEFIVQYA